MIVLGSTKYIDVLVLQVIVVIVMGRKLEGQK